MNPDLCTSVHWRRRLAGFAFLVCVLSTTLPVAAQELPVAKPESVGLSSQRLERIGEAVQHSIDDKRIAGAVTLVARRGRVAWLKAQGMMDREAGKPMQADAIFRICSMSKALTSLAVMMLYEEGHFLLDDPVSKYIPEFKNPKVLVKPASGKPYTIPATKEITIRHLLTHTSGLTFTGTRTWVRCTKTQMSRMAC
jgi:CubicO group peptidase (beta-lactamase class C family)